MTFMDSDEDLIAQSDASADQKAIWRGMIALEQAAGMMPGEEHRDRVACAEAALLPQIDNLHSDAAFAELLEEAAEAGAARIIEALPAVEKEGLAHLTERGWKAVAMHIPIEAIPLMEAKGLALDRASLAAFLSSGRADLITYTLEVLSPARWWFEKLDAATALWLALPDTDVAVAFLEAQVAHHPETAMAAWRMTRKHSEPRQALVLQSALALTPEDYAAHGDARDWLQEHAISHHEALALLQAHATPAALHAHYKLPPDQRPGAR